MLVLSVVAMVSAGSLAIMVRLARDFELALETRVADLARVFSNISLLRAPGQPQVNFTELEEQVQRFQNQGDFGAITIAKLTPTGERVVYPFYVPALAPQGEWIVSPPEQFQNPVPWETAPSVRQLPLVENDVRLGTLYVQLRGNALQTVRVVIAALGALLIAAIGLLVLQFRRQELTISRTTVELEKKRREMVRLERLALAGQLSANLFHDLKKPVLNIKNEVEEMAEGPATSAGIAGRIRQQVELFFGMVREGALDRFVRADEEREYVDINDLLERSLALVRYEQGDIEVRRQYDLSLAPVLASPVRLIQVFSNLILNAYQALQGKGLLEVSSSRQEASIVVTIQDNGPGIPEDVKPHLFEPFFTTKPAGQGTGLGLYICQDIAQDAGGTIIVESRPGQTRFTVTVPSAPA